MRLCLTCYHLWPGEALLCGHCGRSFGGRLCARRHRSPASARCCIQCGLMELTEPTPSLPLGCLPLLLIGGCSLLLGVSAWHAFEPGVVHSGQQALVWLIAIAIVLALLPGQIGRQLRRFASRTMSGLWRLTFWGIGYRLVREFVRSTTALLQGRGRRF